MTISHKESNDALEPHIEFLPAGHRFPSRDARDRRTIQHKDLNDEAAMAQFQDEIQGNATKYSTLNALKQGRLNAERKETQEKIEKLFEQKVAKQQQKLQDHHDMAMKKHKPKPKLRAVKSEVLNSPAPEYKYTTLE